MIRSLAAFAALTLAAAPAGAASSDWAHTDVSQVRLVSAVAAVGQAESVRLGLQFQLDPGWKMYWRSPGDSGSPPMPDFGASENVAAVGVTWPAPQRFLEIADLETAGYVGETVLPLDLRPERPGGAVRVRATVPYQACEKICIPFVADLALDLPAGEAAATPFARLIDRYAARVPRAPEAAGIEVVSVGLSGAPPNERIEAVLRSPFPFEAPDLFVEAPSGFRIPEGTAVLEALGTRARLTAPVEARGGRSLAGQPVTVTVADRGRAIELALTAERRAAAAPVSLLFMLGIALVGGLILNLMPCVLPVLSLKLMGAIGHGGGPRGPVRRGFVASAAGIVVSFLLLAAAAVAVKLAGGAVGWGIQFQQPAFLVFLALVVTLFAYNLLGLFEIALPGRLGAAAVGAEARLGAGTGKAGAEGAGLAGPFATGAFATLLATPCSAPFLGTAASFALGRGPVEIFAVFAALGVGMATPYLAVAAFPGLVTRLPRPGRWMLWVRAVLGLALLGTAAWLILVLAALAGGAAAGLVAAVCAAAAPALWLARRGGGPRRLAWGALAAGAVLAFFAPALAPRGGADPGSAAAAAAADGWRPFDAAALGEAVAAGRTVFVDVTADWCVTCKVNKTLVLDAEPVRGRLHAPPVLAMRADWTRPDPAISAYLASFDRYGIPFNAVYGPRAPGGIALPELLRADAVIAALDRAG